MSANSAATPTHPGAVLAAELAELGLSPAEFDAGLGLAAGATAELLAQRDGVTPELALRLSRYFGVTPRFWMDMQNAYDLAIAERKHGATIAAQITPRITLDDIPVWAGGNKTTDNRPDHLTDNPTPSATHHHKETIP